MPVEKFDVEKFRHPHPENNGLYAYAEVPVAMLQMKASANARNSLKSAERDEAGEITKGTEVYKSMTEYLTVEPVISLDGKKAVCLLNEHIVGRKRGVNKADLDFWDKEMKGFNIGYGKWLTIAEARALTGGIKYNADYVEPVEEPVEEPVDEI